MAHSGKTITFATDLLPNENNIYSLGTVGQRWKIHGDVQPIITKSYPAYTCSADSQAKAVLFFGKINITNSSPWQTPWTIHYRIYVSTTENNTQGWYDCYFSVQGSTVTYYNYNNFYSTDYRPIYHHSLLFPKSGYSSYGGYFGVRIQSSRSPASLPRTFKIELLETQNCTVEIFDSIKRFDETYITTNSIAASTIWSYGEYTGTSVGLQESGDANSNDTAAGYIRDAGSSQTTIKVATTLYPYLIMLPSGDGLTYNPINTTNKSTATTKTNIYSGSFNITQDIYYYPTDASVSANGSVRQDRLWLMYALNLRYSFNIGDTLTVGKEVYMVASLDSLTTAHLRNPTATNSNASAQATGENAGPITQTLPTTEDGYIYIYLGRAYTANTITLSMKHPIYWYKNGHIALYNGSFAASTDTISISRNTATSIATINGTEVKIKIPASDNTWRPLGTRADDAMAGNTVVTNVSYTSASDDAEYPILIKNSTGSTATASGVKFDSNITINPSTNTITATNFAGNASSATEIKRFNVTSNDNSNATGYFLVYTWSLGAWTNNRMSFIVNSRHDGAGLIDITVGINSATVSVANVYAQIKYWGATGSGSVISTDSWQIYVLDDATKAYLFAKYNDYNEATITPLTSTRPEKSTWMTAIGSTYGTLKASTSINGANTAIAANLTTTTNAIAYYTDTIGTFGTKASANGALYATGSNGSLNWGTLPVAQGGTGATSAAGARTNLGLGTVATYDVGAGNEGYNSSKTLIPRINADGVMEVGKYIDFHAATGTSKDYDVRITAATTGITITGTTTGTFSGSLTGNASTATTLQNERKIWGRTFDGSADVTGDLDWDSQTYRQRIHITNDSTADTAVFTFQQSEDSGSNYLDLFTIKDNGNVIIGKRMSTTTPSSAVSTNRIAIIPYFHTGGPWYIASKDNTSYAYLTIKYGNTERFEIKSDGRIFVTSTVGAGSSTELGILNAKTTATISNGSWSWGLNHLASGVKAGGNTCLITGVANTTNNAAIFGFHYAGSDNAENYAEISLLNNNGLLKVFTSGQVEITKTTDATTITNGVLKVNGGISVAKAIYMGGQLTIAHSNAGAICMTRTGGPNWIWANNASTSIAFCVYSSLDSSKSALKITQDAVTCYTDSYADLGTGGTNGIQWKSLHTKVATIDKSVTLQWNSTDQSLDFIFA